MEETKKWYASKGIWGALMAGLGGVWAIFEAIHAFVDAHPDMERGVGEAINAITANPAGLLALVGAFFAWYGRWKAKDKISNDPY